MKIDLSIPDLGNQLIDLRDSLPGDNYNWNWERTPDQVNYLAIHHTASPDSQTPEEIADYHINQNGWGGIGYHFLINKEGVVFYVGDISTARANVANLNEQVIGIALIGDFTEGRVPTALALDSAHKLCQFFIDYQDLPNVKSWDKVRGHKELPNQTTICPGDDFSNWRIQIVEGIKLKTENEKVEAIDSLQASLASINQQAIFLQEAVAEKDKQINDLKKALAEKSVSDSYKRPDHTLTILDLVVNLYRLIFPPGKVA